MNLTSQTVRRFLLEGNFFAPFCDVSAPPPPPGGGKQELWSNPVFVAFGWPIFPIYTCIYSTENFTDQSRKTHALDQICINKKHPSKHLIYWRGHLLLLPPYLVPAIKLRNKSCEQSTMTVWTTKWFSPRLTMHSSHSDTRKDNYIMELYGNAKRQFSNFILHVVKVC